MLQVGAATLSQRLTEGVTGGESLGNSTNNAGKKGRKEESVCLTSTEEGGEGLDSTAHTLSHTQTDAFPYKQLGHAGRLGGRM